MKQHHCHKTFIGIDGSSKRLSLNFFGYIPGELLGEKVSLYECEKDSGNVNTGKILNQRLVIKDTYSSKYRIDATSSEDYRSKY